MLKRLYEALGMTAHPFSFQSVCYDSLRMTEDPAAVRRLKTQHNQDQDLQVGSCCCCSLHAFKQNCFSSCADGRVPTCLVCHRDVVYLLTMSIKACWTASCLYKPEIQISCNSLANTFHSNNAPAVGLFLDIHELGLCC